MRALAHLLAPYVLLLPAPGPPQNQTVKTFALSQVVWGVSLSRNPLAGSPGPARSKGTAPHHTSYLLRFNGREKGAALPIHCQQDALVAGLLNQSVEIRLIINGLPVYLLDHIASLQTGFRR
jgi:hypothetical protein